MGVAVAAISACALWMRSFSNHLYGGKPMEVLNPRANRDSDSLVRPATSSKLTSPTRCFCKYSFAIHNCQGTSPLTCLSKTFPVMFCTEGAKRGVIRGSPEQ